MLSTFVFIPKVTAESECKHEGPNFTLNLLLPLAPVWKLSHHGQIHRCIFTVTIFVVHSHRVCVQQGFCFGTRRTCSYTLWWQSSGETVSSGSHLHQWGSHRRVQVCPQPYCKCPPACSGQYSYKNPVQKAAWGCCNTLSVGDFSMFNKGSGVESLFSPLLSLKYQDIPALKACHMLIDLTSRGQSSCQWDPILEGPFYFCWKQLCRVKLQIRIHLLTLLQCDDSHSEENYIEIKFSRPLFEFTSKTWKIAANFIHMQKTENSNKYLLPKLFFCEGLSSLHIAYNKRNIKREAQAFMSRNEKPFSFTPPEKSL